MPAWPAALPQTLNQEGYSEAPQSGVVRTSMDSGPDFVRRRFSATTTNISGSMLLTETEWAALLTFFETTLLGGSLSFTWHPYGLHEASPQTILTMRFLAPPVRRPVAGRYLWHVDMQFEVLP